MSAPTTKRTTSSLAGSALLALTLIMGGCGSSPTAPDVRGSSTVPSTPPQLVASGGFAADEAASEIASGSITAEAK